MPSRAAACLAVPVVAIVLAPGRVAVLALARLAVRMVSVSKPQSVCGNSSKTLFSPLTGPNVRALLEVAQREHVL